MIILGLVLGVFVWATVNSFTVNYVVHRPDTGILPGFIAGIWVARPMILAGIRKRIAFLNPPAAVYPLPLKVAFAKVRQLLSDRTYKFGDKWHVTTADTVQERITANLRFTDDEMRIDGVSFGAGHRHMMRKQRLIELDILFKDVGGDKCELELFFIPKVEGFSFFACDLVVIDLRKEIEGALGRPVKITEIKAEPVLIAPWWLLWVSAVALCLLAGDIAKAVFPA